jgi:hypothetical protein
LDTLQYYSSRHQATTEALLKHRQYLAWMRSHTAETRQALHETTALNKVLQAQVAHLQQQLGCVPQSEVRWQGQAHVLPPFYPDLPFCRSSACLQLFSCQKTAQQDQRECRVKLFCAADEGESAVKS